MEKALQNGVAGALSSDDWPPIMLQPADRLVIAVGLVPVVRLAQISDKSLDAHCSGIAQGSKTQGFGEGFGPKMDGDACSAA